MRLSERIAGALILSGFTARAIDDGLEYSARVIGAAEGGAICPSGTRVMRFTIDASERWLARVDGWGKAERELDLRTYASPFHALRDISGGAWPAIRAIIESARAESCQQNDLARIAAGLAKGRRKAHFLELASVHHRNAMGLDDALSEPSDSADMSIDDLLKELAA